MGYRALLQCNILHLAMLMKYYIFLPLWAGLGSVLDTS